MQNVRKCEENKPKRFYWTAQAWEQTAHNDQDSNLQKIKNYMII